MTDNTPEAGTVTDTALTLDEAAHAMSGLLSDDPETDTDAVEDTHDDADAEDADTEADEADEDAEAEDTEDDADNEGEEDDEPALTVTDETPVTLEDGSTVTLAELKKGNLRQADYTRKTQEIAEVRKSVEAKNSQLDGAVQDVIQKYQVLEKFLTETAPPRPSLQMAEEDPFGFQAAQARFYEHQERVQQISGQLSHLRQHEEQQKQQREAEEYQRSMQDLIAWNPALADPSKRQALGAKLVKPAEKYGFSPEDLGKMRDTRVIRLLADAAKYQELQAQAPKAVQKAKKAPPVTKPQQRQSQKATQRKAVDQKLQTLRKSGRAEDAAAVLFNIID